MVDMPLTAHQRDLALRAAEVLRVKGLQARTREIAEAIGVSEAWLFRHFKNKEEVFAALRSLHEEKVVAFVDGFCAAEASATRALAGLTALIEHVVVEPQRDPVLARRFAEVHGSETAADMRAFMENTLGRFIAAWGDSYALAEAEGWFVNRLGSTAELLWAAHHLLFGISFFQSSSLTPASDDAGRPPVERTFWTVIQLLGATDRGRAAANAFLAQGAKHD